MAAWPVANLDPALQGTTTLLSVLLAYLIDPGGRAIVSAAGGF